LDNLLAPRGGRKFNLNNICLQIDDKQKVIEKITDRMRKTDHVPVQIWRGWNPNKPVWRMLLCTGRFKTLIGAMILASGARLILPCLVPLVLHQSGPLWRSLQKGKQDPHVMML
jgi:hypothetical protein